MATSRPACVADQTPVTKGIRGFETQRRDRRAVLERRAKGQNRRGRHERRVGEEDQNVVMPPRDRVAGGQNRMSGAKPLFLHENFRARAQLGGLGAHILAAGSDDDRDAAGLGAGDARQHMRQHRASGDLMQNLRATGFHARALAGGEDNGEGASAVC